MSNACYLSMTAQPNTAPTSSPSVVAHRRPDPSARSAPPLAGDADGVVGSTIELGDLDLAVGDVARAAARYGAALADYGEARNLMFLCAGLAAVAAAAGVRREAGLRWGAA